jgi:hypothetical protein
MTAAVLVELLNHRQSEFFQRKFRSVLSNGQVKSKRAYTLVELLVETAK